MGIFKSEVLYENHEIRLLKDPHPSLILKSTNCKFYRVVVNCTGVTVFKANRVIYKKENIRYVRTESQKNRGIKENVYDILGRKIKSKLRKRGTYFKVFEDKRRKVVIMK